MRDVEESRHGAGPAHMIERPGAQIGNRGLGDVVRAADSAAFAVAVAVNAALISIDAESLERVAGPQIIARRRIECRRAGCIVDQAGG